MGLTKRLSTALALVATLTSTSATAGPNFTVGLSLFYGGNPFVITLQNGARKAVEDWKAKGVNINMLVTNGGDTDTTRQIGDLEDLYAQGVNGLVVFPGDSVVVSEPVKNIYNKNHIPVVVADTGLNSGKYDYLVISNNFEGGQRAAELMAKNLKPSSSVIVFDNATGVAVAQARINGFETRAKELGLKVITRKTLKLSLEDGRRTMQDTILSSPEVSGVFFINQLVAQGAYAALVEAKRTDVKLVSFDLDRVSYQMVKDGRILGLVVQDPYKIGYESMNAMAMKLMGATLKAHEDLLPTKVLTKENASAFADDPQVTGK
ncbi:substrate-binding domain-containing protein [Paraburkholderia largidicola]|uniref:ABC transporter substrate-binding protein n=1 Tax=Paraburkholderia largidicola TaxID=3014751 RepID=A0A7I8C1Z5_9BURK|nr:substrate-binding domain-containing protein [Paraburkholderia sp. PGU16]BCF95044.1 ABC transporter substrate-binding protein [Paraburkholderia sp. PGU16]